MQVPTCIFQDCIKWVQTSSQPFVLCLNKPKGSCYADFHPWEYLFPKNASSPCIRVSFLNSLCALEVLSCLLGSSIPASTGQPLLGCVLLTAVGSAVLGYPEKSKSEKQLW